MKGSSSDYEDIGIHKFIRRIQVDILKEEVKVWKSSLKQQEAPPEPSKSKDEI